jgi:hypothetical protein
LTQEVHTETVAEETDTENLTAETDTEDVAAQESNALCTEDEEQSNFSEISERETDTNSTASEISGRETDTNSTASEISEGEMDVGSTASVNSERETDTESTVLESSEEETTEAPLQTGILQFELSHPELLQVAYGGDEDYDAGEVYHGGNQSWFYNAATGEGDQQLENEGCGLMAAADTLLYLSLYHEGYEALIAPSAFLPETLIDYNAYQSYVLGLRARTDLFPFSAEFGGALGTSLAKGIEQYSVEQGYTIQAQWGGRLNKKQRADYVNSTSARTMLAEVLEPEKLEDTVEAFQKKTNTILGMLERDIPVIMAVGPFSEMTLYADDGSGDLEVVGTVGSHYFIVTGAEVNFDTNQILMEIETWGEIYVIDYLEFSGEIYKGMAYLSDILYLDVPFLDGEKVSH